MSVSRLFFGVLTIVSIVFSILLPMAQAQSTAPAPAPISDVNIGAKYCRNNNRPRNSMCSHVGGFGPHLSYPLILFCHFDGLYLL
ncbi:hypothetical protein EUTSA_v10005210mg [Eutrema salsugineum]|uniref:Uncharacterized protein n=1 Tax=Eutrema salsugineum TaxID=72664 RepID=V4KL38_EUTSA|nr:hypothetical protein EUTSA_v10005210mg [Eutrema salsugineum]